MGRGTIFKSKNLNLLSEEGEIGGCCGPELEASSKPLTLARRAVAQPGTARCLSHKGAIKERCYLTAALSSGFPQPDSSLRGGLSSASSPPSMAPFFLSHTHLSPKIGRRKKGGVVI